MKSSAKLHNRFDIEVYDIESKKTTKAQAENIILNTSLPSIISSTIYTGYVGVGTGTGILSPTRTKFFSYLGRASTSVVEIVFDTDYTAHKTVKAVFNETVANGVWTEIGLMSANPTYYTHALITDGEGNPISIEKTDTKIITVYATIYAELQESNQRSTIHYGADNAILNKLVGLGTSYMSAHLTSAITIDGKPSQLGAYAYTSGVPATDMANMRRYANWKFNRTAGNGPIRGLIVSHAGSHDISKIAGGAILPLDGIFQNMAYTGVEIGIGNGITTEYDFPVDFPTPLSERIYVGGILKTRGIDYEIHYGPKANSNIQFQTISGWKLNPIIEETIVLPNPPAQYFDDGAYTVNSIRFRDSNMVFKIELSTDGVNFILVGNDTITSSAKTFDYTTFPQDKYKYLKVTLNSTSAVTDITELTVFSTPPNKKHIRFFQPPSDQTSITADWTIEYINKTDNYTMDLQADEFYNGVS